MSDELDPPGEDGEVDANADGEHLELGEGDAESAAIVPTEAEKASHPSLHWREGRATLSWPKVLGAMAAMLALWLVLDATTLAHNAEVSPVGTRRSISLSLLRPLAATSSALQLADLEKAANVALGRTSEGGSTRRTFVTLGPRKRPSPHGTSVTSTTLDPLTHASAAAPVRVLLLGDSLGLDLGGSLQNALASTGIVTATLDGKESTGLTRPDYFSWPGELQGDLASLHPQIIVAMMGANDPQDFPGPPDLPFGTAAWNVEYQRRCVSFMELATSQGAKLVWVSLPPMQDPALSAKVATINALQESAALQVPGVTYVNSSSVLAAPGGGYAAFTLVNGREVNVRTPDGIHITPQGGDLLAAKVMSRLRSGLGIPLP